MSLQDKIEKAIYATGKCNPVDTRVIATAVMGALRPHEAVEDSKPVILYFRTEEDREELIAAILEVKPDMTAVRVD